MNIIVEANGKSTVFTLREAVRLYNALNKALYCRVMGALR